MKFFFSFTLISLLLFFSFFFLFPLFFFSDKLCNNSIKVPKLYSLISLPAFTKRLTDHKISLFPSNPNCQQMCGQHKEVARECLSWKSFCVSNIEEIISEFKDSQHNLENTVTFIHDNKRVFNESHGCPNTN